MEGVDKFKNFKNKRNNIKKVTQKDWSKLNNKVNFVHVWIDNHISYFFR